jgi:hypothetical protein
VSRRTLCILLSIRADERKFVNKPLALFAVARFLRSLWKLKRNSLYQILILQ